jgi:hypothetical protein
MDLHDKVIERLAAPAVPTGPIIQAGEAAHNENLTVLLYRLVGTWQLGEKVGLVERYRVGGILTLNARVSLNRQGPAANRSLSRRDFGRRAVATPRARDIPRPGRRRRATFTAAAGEIAGLPGRGDLEKVTQTMKSSTEAA